MPTESPLAAYNRGFNDGLKWVADCLRLAANEVEQPRYAEFERKPPGNGGTFRAISKTGQIHFANQLRDVANEIEKALNDGTQT